MKHFISMLAAAALIALSSSGARAQNYEITGVTDIVNEDDSDSYSYCTYSDLSNGGKVYADSDCPGGHVSSATIKVDFDVAVSQIVGGGGALGFSQFTAYADGAGGTSGTEGGSAQCTSTLYYSPVMSNLEYSGENFDDDNTYPSTGWYQNFDASTGLDVILESAVDANGGYGEGDAWCNVLTQGTLTVK